MREYSEEVEKKKQERTAAARVDGIQLLVGQASSARIDSEIIGRQLRMRRRAVPDHVTRWRS